MSQQLISKCFIFMLVLQLIQSEWWDDYKGIKITQATFLQYVGKDQHVFVDFFTPWCHWCKTMAPDWGQIYKHYHEQPQTRKDIIIAKLNCEDEQEFCGMNGINSFPRVYYYKPRQEKPETGFAGYQPFDKIREFIELKAGPAEEVQEIKNQQSNLQRELAEKEAQMRQMMQETQKRQREMEIARAEEERIRREQEERNIIERQEQRVRRERQEKVLRQLEEIKVNQQKIIREAEIRQLEKDRIQQEELEQKQQVMQLNSLGDGPVNFSEDSIEGQLQGLVDELRALKFTLTEYQLQSEQDLQSFGDQLEIVQEQLKIISVASANDQKNKQSSEKHASINWTHAFVFIMTGLLVGVVVGFICQPASN